MSLTTKLDRYPDYQESGSEWVGDVPSHWELVRLGRIGRLFKGTGGTKEDATPVGVPCVRYGDLYSHEFLIIASRSCVTVEKASAYTSIKFGDVLFAGSGETLDEIGKSAANLIAGEAVCGGDVLVLRPTRNVDPRFLGYATDYSGSRHQKACMGRGVTVMHIYGDDLKYLLLALPPLGEQIAIARYLAAFNHRTNRLVRIKRRLIEVLNEQRRQLIHERVFRGTDEQPTRDSGVPWLGHIPTSWELKRAKWYYREQDTRSTSGTEELLSVSHITGVTRRSEKNVSMFKAASYTGHKVCMKDDLVVNTMWAWMGALGISPELGLVSPAYAIYRPRQPDLFDPQFTDHLLRTPTYVAEFLRRSTGIRASRLRLYPPQFMDVPIVRPPLDEQRRIVREIASATAEVDHSIKVAQREIELLNEYRTKMMFEVLSGKRDVRAAALDLPEDDGEVLDEPNLDEVDEFLEDDVADLEPAGS